jgi:hypothetical protein
VDVKRALSDRVALTLRVSREEFREAGGTGTASAQTCLAALGMTF